MDFEWTVKMENETEILTEIGSDDKDNMSFLTISVDKGRTYRCVANNSVGVGTMCSIEITGNENVPSILNTQHRCRCLEHRNFSFSFETNSHNITNATISILTDALHNLSQYKNITRNLIAYKHNLNPTI